MQRPRFDCYQCEEDDCNVSEEHLSACKDAIYCWKSTTIQATDGKKQNARGCIFNERHSRLFCQSSMQRVNSHTECCTKEFCNGGDFPILEAPNPDEYSGGPNPYVWLSSFGPIVGAIFIIGLVMIITYYRKPRRRERRELMRIRLGLDDDSNDEITNLSRKINLLEMWTTGSYVPNAPELWRGTYNGRKVIVKIYPFSSKVTWAYEADVYTSVLTTKHDNILHYVTGGMTMGVQNHVKQFWLVTRFHRNGPLERYLKETRLDKKAMLKACSTLTRGLAYLHEEIGMKGKRPMAHRNLCSYNVFVKRDGSCVIGGFECSTTSVRELVSRNSLFIELAAKRYMSPEYLSLDIAGQLWSLDSFQRADLYSLGIIFWEICTMCSDNKNVAPKYSIPFSDWLAQGNDIEPTFDEMRQAVVVGQLRPAIPERWRTDPVMEEMLAIMEACWNKDIAMRRSLLDIKKDLAKIPVI